MTNDNNKSKLFSEFPPVSTTDWMEKISTDLKGADYDKKLVWNTLEGFSVQPYYRSEDLAKLPFTESLPGQYPYIRGNKTHNNWETRQEILVDNIENANKKALEIIEKGVSSLHFIVERFNNPRLIYTFDNFSALVKDLPLDKVELIFSGGKFWASFTEFLRQEAKNRNIAPEKLRGSFCFDPMGYWLQNGKPLCKTIDEAFINTQYGVEAVKEALPNFSLITINGQHYGNAGANIVQELGFSLAQANEYFAKTTELGTRIDDLAPRMSLNFSVGSNYFMEIAKIRAARILWAKIVEAYKPENEASKQVYISAVTSDWNKTAYDPYVNMLRTTTEAMSSAIGGADALTVKPFNSTFGNATEVGERVARNTQSILKEEAYLDKIVDPSAGSYYIETLTQSITEHAWNYFLAVEEKGGFIEASKAGYIQETIKATAAERDVRIATRRDVLLGTNQYPNFNEEIAETLTKKAIPVASKTEVTPLTPYRGAMAFETLRLQTEAAEKQPKVFLLTYGNLNMRKARAMFASNFFACAGYQIIDNSGFATVEEGTKAALAANADITVICSSDDEYADIVIPAYEQLNGKSQVVIAGFPKALINQFKEAGIKHFIHVKSNLLETLQEFQKLVL